MKLAILNEKKARSVFFNFLLQRPKLLLHVHIYKRKLCLEHFKVLSLIGKHLLYRPTMTGKSRPCTPFRRGHLRTVKSKYNLTCLQSTLYNIHNKKGQRWEDFGRTVVIWADFFTRCFLSLWEIISVVKAEEMTLNWKGNPIGVKMAFNVRKEFPFKQSIYKRF